QGVDDLFGPVAEHGDFTERGSGEPGDTVDCLRFAGAAGAARTVRGGPAAFRGSAAAGFRASAAAAVHLVGDPPRGAAAFAGSLVGSARPVVGFGEVVVVLVLAVPSGGLGSRTRAGATPGGFGFVQLHVLIQGVRAPRRERRGGKPCVSVPWLVFPGGGFGRRGLGALP